MPIVKIQIGETVFVSDAHGSQIPVTGNNPLALLALISLKSSLRVDRFDIEKTLWSTRPREQAGGSLRQLLNQLRKLLGDCGGALKSDRKAVWFDKKQIEVIFDKHCSPAQLLRSVRVRDPEFEKWLGEIRKQWTTEFTEHNAIDIGSSETPGADRFVNSVELLLISDIPSIPEAQLIRELVVSQTVRNLQETSTLQTVVLDDCALVSGTKAELVMECRFGQVKSALFATISVKSSMSGLVFWTRTIQLPQEASHSGFNVAGSVAEICQAFSHEASEKILNCFANSDNEASAKCRAEAITEIALRELFSFELRRIKNAEKLFSRAYDLYPHAIQLAWRTCANMFAYVEGDTDNVEQLRQLNNALTEEILDYRQANGVALSLVSQSKLLLDQDFDSAEVFAQDAHAINPGNPFTLAGLANVAAAKSNHKLAAELLAQSLSIGRFSMQRHWWLIFLSLALIRQGKFEEAISPAKSALIKAKNFRAPMRHLYALYLKVGDRKNAAKTLQLLRNLEPDFSLEKIRSSPLYPASTIRATELIELDDLPDEKE